MTFTTEELRSVAILEGLPDSHLAWLANHGDKVPLARGDHLFERGQPADFMFIVVSGGIDGYEDVGGHVLRVATTRPGQVTGMLPFSRMTHYPRYTVAVEDSQVLRVRKRDFPEMLAISHELGQRLVGQMSDRVRGDVRLEQQRDKMAALGRLSAGLAHELNNPAAAVRRSAAGLADEVTGLTDLVSNLVRHHLEDAHIRAIDRLRHTASGRTVTDSGLARSQREERLTEWLEERAVAKAWDLAGSFADAGVTAEDLDDFARMVPEAVQPDALAWVACDLSVQRIVSDIASSAERISDLVTSVKMYSHVDRSPEHKPTDVREGLDTTLTLLSHKLKTKNIRLIRDYQNDVPSIPANAGELNQVWTNLIDNAIDAVDDGGEVRLEVHGDDDYVTVSIADNGPGIPEDVRSRIFEPFFTTKTVGEGTGLGLDIAMRIVKTHQGALTVESTPRKTTAYVRLPVSPRFP